MFFSSTFETRENLKKHIRNAHSDSTYSCDECGKICKSKAYLRNHVLAVHIKKTKPPSHQCDACGKMFHDKCKVTAHYRMAHLNEPATCEICGKQMKNTISLQNHMRQHDETREMVEWTCDICDKTYKCLKSGQKASKERHLESHKEKQYECDFCYRKYRKLADLQCHIDADHNGIFKYKCERCQMVC